MVRIEIREEACRGCEMCADVCPTQVIAHDAGRRKARVQAPEDCIACLSCAYLCPSGAIQQGGYHAVRNFYRDLDFSQRVERYL